MKKLITILGAGLLAFGMFTSCGAKDVNLSWSDEYTSYNYTCDVTAGSISVIDEPTSYTEQENNKAAALLYTTSVGATFKYATVSWSEGYQGQNAQKSEGNVDSYRIDLVYDLEYTSTEKASGNIEKQIWRNFTETFYVKKVGDKYFLNLGADNQAEVTIDGDIDDDEFTFSADVFNTKFVDSWKADGSTEYYKGDSSAVQKAVKIGRDVYNPATHSDAYVPAFSYSGITVVRK